MPIVVFCAFAKLILDSASSRSRSVGAGFFWGIRMIAISYTAAVGDGFCEGPGPYFAKKAFSAF